MATSTAAKATVKSATAKTRPVAAKRAVKSPARKVAPAPKPVATKAVARAAAPAAKAVAAPKTKTPKKPKLVRDSFTMPKDEYQAIDGLKQRANSLQRNVKKSELLRAGIMALSAMDDKNLVAILAKVPALKTGRPGRA